MHPSICLAEEALRLAQQELTLLDEGKLDEVEASAQRRTKLMDDAWAQRSQECIDQLTQRFEALHELQKQMIQKAQTLHGSLAEGLKDMRRRGTRQKGYQQVCTRAYADIPTFISRRS